MLAGGRATRFGSDKLVADHEGMPLLHHAILRVAQACDDVVVVLAPAAEASGLPPGVAVTHDPIEGQGPLVGLLQGLTAATRSDRVVVAGGDMPDLRVPVLDEMLRVLDEAAVDAVALSDGKRTRPLPCVLRTRAAAGTVDALLSTGHRRLGDVLDAMRTAVIDEPTWTALDPGRRTLFDVDEPRDLRS